MNPSHSLSTPSECSLYINRLQGDHISPNYQFIIPQSSLDRLRRKPQPLLPHIKNRPLRLQKHIPVNRKWEPARALYPPIARRRRRKIIRIHRRKHHQLSRNDRLIRSDMQRQIGEVRPAGEDPAAEHGAVGRVGDLPVVRLGYGAG